MAVNVPINFLANVDDAAKEVSKLGTAFKVVGAAFVASKIVDGFQALAKGLGQAVDAAAEAEVSYNKMASALKLAGDFSEQNAAAFEDLANQIQSTTKFDDDLVLSQVAVAKQFGATNKEAEKLIKAAVDLAARTGMELPQATELLGRSLDGTAGKLNELVPGMRSLTSEQLAAGGAIDLVAEKFAGAASGELATYSGAIAQLGNGFGDLVESIGSLITNNAAVKAGVRGLTEVIKVLKKIFDENKLAIQGFISDGVILAANAFGTFIEVLSRVDAVITGMIVGIKTLGYGLAGIGRFVSEIAKGNLAKAFSVDTAAAEKFNESVGKSVDGLQARQQTYARINTAVAEQTFNITKAAEAQAMMKDEVEKTSIGFDKQLPKIKRVSTEIINEFKALEGQLKSVAATERETLIKQLTDGLLLTEKALKSGAISRQRYNDAAEKLQIRFVKAIGEIEKKEFEESEKLRKEANAKKQKEREEEAAEIERHFKDLQERLKGLISDPASGLFSGSNMAGLTEGVQSAIARGLGGVGLLLKGGQGAKQLLGGIAEQMGQAFLGVPGFGALFEALAMGPDQVRAMVTEFVNALPDIIVAVVDSIPVLIETLAERLSDPVFVEKLVNALVKAIASPKIILAMFAAGDSFRRAILDATVKFVEKFISGATKFVGELVAGAGQFVVRILEGAVNFVGKLLEGAGQFIQKLIDEIGKGIGDIGGNILNPGGKGGSSIIPGVNIIPDSIPIIGGLFAKGGLVPEGFPNDSFPARLTSGEQVIDRTDNERLSRFLDQQERGTERNLTVNLIIGEDQLAKVMLNLNRRGFRTA